MILLSAILRNVILISVILLCAILINVNQLSAILLNDIILNVIQLYAILLIAVFPNVIETKDYLLSVIILDAILNKVFLANVTILLNLIIPNVTPLRFSFRVSFFIVSLVRMSLCPLFLLTRSKQILFANVQFLNSKCHSARGLASECYNSAKCHYSK